MIQGSKLLKKEVKKEPMKRAVSLLLSAIMILAGITCSPTEVMADTDTPITTDNGVTYSTVHVHRELTAEEYQKNIDEGGDPNTSDNPVGNRLQPVDTDRACRSGKSQREDIRPQV